MRPRKSDPACPPWLHPGDHARPQQHVHARQQCGPLRIHQPRRGHPRMHQQRHGLPHMPQLQRTALRVHVQHLGRPTPQCQADPFQHTSVCAPKYARSARTLPRPAVCPQSNQPYLGTEQQSHSHLGAAKSSRLMPKHSRTWFGHQQAKSATQEAKHGSLWLAQQAKIRPNQLASIQGCHISNPREQQLDFLRPAKESAPIKGKEESTGSSIADWRVNAWTAKMQQVVKGRKQMGPHHQSLGERSARSASQPIEKISNHANPRADQACTMRSALRSFPIRLVQIQCISLQPFKAIPQNQPNHLGNF